MARAKLSCLGDRTLMQPMTSFQAHSLGVTTWKSVVRIWDAIDRWLTRFARWQPPSPCVISRAREKYGQRQLVFDGLRQS